MSVVGSPSRHEGRPPAAAAAAEAAAAAADVDEDDMPVERFTADVAADDTAPDAPVPLLLPPAPFPFPGPPALKPDTPVADDDDTAADAGEAEESSTCERSFLFLTWYS